MPRTFAFLVVLTMPAWATAPLGIPRELAEARAKQISNLHYKLQYSLQTTGDTIVLDEELDFALKQADPLLLDFREGAISELRVNDKTTRPVAESGHLLLPQERLRAGENNIKLSLTVPIAAAGKALTRYQDKDDGSQYIYTLLVPMDASMAFACFDQPDLKARFQLSLVYPQGWTVIANESIERQTGRAGWGEAEFHETEPISTYLFAFAAGPFQRVRARDLPDVYVRQSQLARTPSEVPRIQRITADGMKFLAEYFAQPFPFGKYDMVLIPGFPYGGMEHAGATFLNEDSMLFRSAPTENDRFGRDITVLHELTHQWFGDFTTMRWFDDLWLKEGFAQYMAFKAMDKLAPQQNVWAHFYQQIKPAAYGIDVTLGTTPIYQDIPNLRDAKSAYGAIVYSKAPGILRQLAFLLGDEPFRNGLRLYLSEHKYGNAEWSDLVRALERSSGQSLGKWADAWIHRRGMPEVTVQWSCNSKGRLVGLTIKQQNILGEGGTWPLATQVLLGYEDAPGVRLRVEFNGEETSLAEAKGKACPGYVFANDQDYGYGLFFLDTRSRAYLQKHVGRLSDVFERTLAWGALFDAAHFAQMAPGDYLGITLRELPAETDELLLRSVSSRSIVALHDYIHPRLQLELTPRFEALAMDRMLNAPEQGQRILWFRAFVSLASSPEGLNKLKKLLDGRAAIPGVQLRPLDRWRMITALLAHGDVQANAIYDAEAQLDKSGIGQKYAYVTAAAKADGATKHRYFEDYLHNPDRPEDWVQDSLAAFNQWNESDLTRLYLKPALEALPQVKQQRKIFFVLAWLDAFIGGQHSEEADREVHEWLRSAQLDSDLKLKVLQVVDELDRTTKIRRVFP